ncbi:MAG: DUF262 domain-containing HNH endonuclease family protein [Lentisphaeria bacterium]|nr:DUF262 domain-containing HNH endonuclease family protein [Lentisphaeria bacterium]
MEAGKRNLGSMFQETRRYLVPLFQRRYVWKQEENWEPLWEDVRILAERRLARERYQPHFMGAIVLDLDQLPTGNIETRKVIDGQQRLTTLQLMLAAIRDICEELGESQYHEHFRTLTKNSYPNLSEDDEQVFKVWPTNGDQEAFVKTVAAGSPDKVKIAFDVNTGNQWVWQQIPDAYLYFHKTITEWIEEHKPQYPTQACIDALYFNITNYLYLVVIDLDRSDDAQVIFETLNARGTPLAPSDLVKNFLLHEGSNGLGEEVVLYENYWSPLDEDGDFWQAEIRQGRLTRLRLDIFLQFYLTLMRDQDIRADRLFPTFRDWVRIEDPRSAEQHLDQLLKYARIYQSFWEFNEESRIGVFFDRLQALDTTTLYPCLLGLFHELGDLESREELEACLVVIESFLVRRTVCRLTTKNYNRLFLDLVKYIKKTEPTAASIENFFLLSDSDSSRWPDDEEFGHAWHSEPIYNSLVRARVRMLLEALDKALFTEKTEKVWVPKYLQIEHLMPQSWTGHWPLPESITDTEEATDARDHLVHTIGNLTLLTKKLNPSLSNGPWEKKRPEILKHSAINLNRAFQDENAKNWDEERIRDRTQTLLKLALRIWPHPGEVSQD